MERMMKVQDVLLKAMAGKITWWAAAEILGVTDRTMRRWRERLEKHGYSGLADRRKGKPSVAAHSAGDGTFPPRRLPLLLTPKRKQRPNPNTRRRPNGRITLFHKEDKSRILRT